ncbi:MAG: glycoside hydrolase family 127 protein, partial [Promethearchaeota archaeon]
KLEENHHIDNFRIAAGEKKGIHRGDFYYDSDLYKFLEGALYFTIHFDLSEDLVYKIRDIIKLIKKSQLNDGYLNTYYSLNFLNKRFTNLLIFHELYCTGHLIEAAMAEKGFFDKRNLLEVSKQFANLLVKRFLNPKVNETSGHPEIELALIKLYRETSNETYLNLCKHLIETRGKIPHLRTYVMRRLIDAIKTFGISNEIKEEYLIKKGNKEFEKEESAEFLEALSLKDWLIFLQQNLNGKIYQLNKSIRDSYEPIGHAVRALYLYSGVTDLYSETGDETLLRALELIWLKMVKAKMYITGGTGSVKAIEGFGKDFDLKVENSYSETCAAIANIMWNWRLLLVSNKIKYADLIEHLLYNAMLVGQSLDGKKYFYNNCLISNGEEERKEWFKCPCCPTNFIRIIPKLGQYIYTTSKSGIWVHQYIGSELNIPSNFSSSIKIKQNSQFPWNGKVSIKFISRVDKEISLYLRVPKWCESLQLYLNDEEIVERKKVRSYLQIKRKWKEDEILRINLNMEPKLFSDIRNRKQTIDKKYIQYGPLVYCLEDLDNRNNGFPHITIAAEPNLKTEFESSLLKGILTIKGDLSSGKSFTAIPYFAWANRGRTKMRVWIDSIK